MNFRKIFGVSISMLGCLQVATFAASCPKGMIKNTSLSDVKIVDITTGNWEGEKEQQCQWRDGQDKTFCPTFTSRDWGRDILSKEGKWVPFSNDRLPLHKAKGWNVDRVSTTFYDPNKNTVVEMSGTKIRTGNPAVTDKYIQLKYSRWYFYPCEKVSF